jgi:hypothetical protein
MPSYFFDVDDGARVRRDRDGYEVESGVLG